MPCRPSAHRLLCSFAIRKAWLPLLIAVIPLYPQQFAASPASIQPETDITTLQYEVEWRMIRAGTARLTYTPPSERGTQANLRLESGGIVSKLYKVDDSYFVTLDKSLCTLDTFLKAHEGRRRRETKVAFDHIAKKASYLERDMIKDTVVNEKEIEIPGCVHDVIGGLLKLRTVTLQPGESMQFPMSDGKKSVTVRVEAQEREEVKTSLGKFPTMRYEVFLFNNVLYSRKGRMFVWITEDERRLPVRFRARMAFYVGTLTFELEKESKS